MDLFLIGLLMLVAASLSVAWFGGFTSGFLVSLFILRRHESRPWGVFLVSSAVYLSWTFARWLLCLVLPAIVMADVSRVGRYGVFAGALLLQLWASETLPLGEVLRFVLRLHEDGESEMGSYVFGTKISASVVGIVVGSLAAALYAPTYYDGAERSGVREWPWFRALRFWRLWHLWLGLELDLGLSPKEIEGGAILGVHPHGIFPSGAPAVSSAHGGAFDLGLDVRIAVTGWVFWIPVVRELCLWLGCVDVRKEVVNALLARGTVLGLNPGGVQEMILSKVDALDLYLGHQGFLRAAWDASVPAVPVFSSGENRVWSNLAFDFFPKFRGWCTSRGGYPFPLPVPFGPFPVGVKVCVGKPVSPSKYATFDDFRGAYWTALRQLIVDKEDRRFPPPRGLLAKLDAEIARKTIS